VGKKLKKLFGGNGRDAMEEPLEEWTESQVETALKLFSEAFVARLLEKDESEPSYYSVPSLMDYCLSQHFMKASISFGAEKKIKQRLKTLQRKEKVAALLRAEEEGIADSHTSLYATEEPWIQYLTQKLCLWQKTQSAPILHVFFPEVFEEAIDRPVFSEKSDLNNVESLLRSIGERGILRLLGLRETTGTIRGVFSPKKSVLLESFCALHSKHGSVVDLTVGGRALSKHCRRCSAKWWGDAQGSAPLVNAKALRVINRILKHGK
jgi:hypothetical protein